MPPLTIERGAGAAEAQRPEQQVSEAVLRQLLNASTAMRRSEDPDRVLDVLVSTAPLVAPVASVWAAWKSRGAPLTHISVFDPSVVPGDGTDPATAIEAGLDEWSDRLASGHPAFEVDGAEIGLRDGAGRALRISVFPMSTATRIGALLVAGSLAEVAPHQPVIGLLCDHASTALELMCARGTGLRAEAVSEMLGQLTVSHSDPELTLQTIVRKAADLLEADAAYIMLADHDRRLLRVRTAHGITSGAFFETEFSVDELLPGAAIRSRRVMCVRDLQAHEEARNSRSEGLRTTVCAPMFVEDDLVGVLMASHREVRDLPREDRRIIEALAHAAAVSITNSRLHAEREESISQLAELNQLLEIRSAAGERTLDFQCKLTERVLAAGGLEQIVSAMTETLGCRVVILDRELAPLHAPADAEHDLASIREAIAAREEAGAEPGLSRLSAGEQGLLVAPLDLAGERSAHVVVLADEDLDGSDRGMVEAAVTAIGLELMRERANAEAEARLTGGLFQTLFSGEEVDEAAIARRASYLGYELSGANGVIAVVAAEPSDGVDRRLNLETCIQRVVRRSRDLPTAVFERDEAIFVVVSDPEHVSRETLDEQAATIRQELAVSGRLEGVRIAHAGPHHGIAGLRRAAEEATYALHVLRVLGREGKPQAFGDLGIWTLLGSVEDPSSLAIFAESVLGELIAHDRERDTHLVETLRTLVECNFHYRTAAETMYAHPNTLRYRMSRIKELTDLDFSDADDRLRVELALRVLDVVDPFAEKPPAEAGAGG